MNPLRHVLSFSLIFSLFSTSNAFSFHFTSNPTQCSQLTAEWDGGQAPFTLLLVPIGHLNPETRLIHQEDVSSGNSVSFTLDYPAKSQFIAVLNDATGIGAGGTSAIITVGDSSDSSCLSTSTVSPEFFLFLPDSVNQCGSVDISWGSGSQGPVSILGLIPGGQSFQIASVSGSTSTDWTADVRSGTDVVFVAGDQNGLGKGGSTDVMAIGSGSDSCINNNAPSSTPGSPAGGVSSSTSQSQSSSRTQTSGLITTTNNAGSTVTVASPPTITTTDSSGRTITITAGSVPFTTTDSSGHTLTIPGSPITTTDNSGSTVTLGGSTFPGSGGGTVTGSSSDQDSDNSSQNLLPIILGVVFGLLALVGLLVGAFILRRRRSSQHSYSNIEDGRGMQEADGQPWFARGAHLRGGANSSISTLPSMYQTEPFIMPSDSEPQSYYNFSPSPTPIPAGAQQSSFQRPPISSHASSSMNVHSQLDHAPLAPSAFTGYGLLARQSSSSGHNPSASADSKSSGSLGPHGRPPSRTPSGRLIPQGPGMPPVTTSDPPTRVARDSEDFEHEPEEASPNPFEDPVVDIPPTYASVRRASMRRSQDGHGGLHRANASRVSFTARSESLMHGSQES